MSRPRDYSFEALVEVCGHSLSEITTDERGRINAALKQLREVQPDDFLLADLIHERAKQYRDMYEDATLTPQALAGNWSQLPEQHAFWLRKQQAGRTNQAPTLGTCATCDGDKVVLVGHRKSDSPHPDEPGFDLMAVCPDCNSGADAGFWRADGSRFFPPDPARVREMMRE